MWFFLYYCAPVNAVVVTTPHFWCLWQPLGLNAAMPWYSLCSFSYANVLSLDSWEAPVSGPALLSVGAYGVKMGVWPELTISYCWQVYAAGQGCWSLKQRGYIPITLWIYLCSTTGPHSAVIIKLIHSTVHSVNVKNSDFRLQYFNWIFTKGIVNWLVKVCDGFASTSIVKSLQQTQMHNII